MAGFYHLSIKMGSRSSGKSAVSAAAYRSGTKIKNLETGEFVDYTKKSGVIYSEIIIPEYAPTKYMNREILWNEVQKIEDASNSQLFREFELAIPRELTQDQRINVVREFAKHRVAEGMCVDFSIHDPKNKGNPHCHMMCTTRAIISNGENKGSWDLKERKEVIYEKDENGNFIPEIDEKTGKQKIKIMKGKEYLQWKKVPEIDPKTGEQKIRFVEGKGGEKLWLRKTIKGNNWNSPHNGEKWRKDWEEICNKILPDESHIDCRSYERQNIDKIPTIHEGYIARKIEKNGGISERCELNREIKESNYMIERIKLKIQIYLKLLTNSIQEVADELRKRVTEVQRRFERSHEHDNCSERNSGYSEQTAKRDRIIENKEYTSCETNISNEKKEELDSIQNIQPEMEALNERVRKLKERRGIGHYTGRSAERDRSIQKGTSREGARESEAGEKNRRTERNNNSFGKKQCRIISSEEIIRENNGNNDESGEFDDYSQRPC